MIYRYRIEFSDGSSLIEEAYNASDAVIQALFRIPDESRENIKVASIKPAPIANKFMEYFGKQKLNG